jgi:hypothetical protein
VDVPADRDRQRQRMDRALLEENLGELGKHR